MNEGAVNAPIQSQLFPQVRRGVSRTRKYDLHVVGADKFPVGDAHKVFLADVFDGRHFALHLGDDLFYTFDYLVDGLFLATIIEDEGGAVVAMG